MTSATKPSGNWNEIKGKLKQKFTDLTDDDLLLKKGREQETFSRLQTLLGKPKDEPKYLIDHL